MLSIVQTKILAVCKVWNLSKTFWTVVNQVVVSRLIHNKSPLWSLNSEICFSTMDRASQFLKVVSLWPFCRGYFGNWLLQMNLGLLRIRAHISHHNSERHKQNLYFVGQEINLFNFKYVLFVKIFDFFGSVNTRMTKCFCPGSLTSSLPKLTPSSSQNRLGSDG